MIDRSHIRRRASEGALCRWCDKYIQPGALCLEVEITELVDSGDAYCIDCIQLAGEKMKEPISLYGELSARAEK